MGNKIVGAAENSRTTESVLENGGKYTVVLLVSSSIIILK